MVQEAVVGHSSDIYVLSNLFLYKCGAFSNCCCETREAIQGINYNLATNTCALQNTMNNNTRAIIDSQQAGTRAILDYLCTKENADLRDKVQKLELSASQDRQNALLRCV